METTYKQPRFAARAAQGDVITLPVTDAIYKTLRGAAACRGMPLPQWATAVLLRAAAVTFRDDKSLAS
jgi:hypothetical protein